MSAHPAVAEGWKEALHQAVSAIHFDDSSDFKIALWNIVKALAPEWMDELDSNSAEVFAKSRASLVAHPVEGSLASEAQKDSHQHRYITYPNGSQACEFCSAAPAVLADAQWQPIETAPQNGRTILLGRFNELGNWRTMRGQWFTQAAIDDEWEDPDGFEAGWYETAVEPDVPNCWAIAPTHWMPLPAQPAAPQSASDAAHTATGAQP